MPGWQPILAAVATALAVPPIAPSACQTAAVRSVDERILREYAGVYQWEQDGFLYLQLWNEFSGTNQLVAFYESGEVRTLYPTDRDRFVAGPGAAVSTAVESRSSFSATPAARSPR